MVLVHTVKKDIRVINIFTENWYALYMSIAQKLSVDKALGKMGIRAKDETSNTRNEITQDDINFAIEHQNELTIVEAAVKLNVNPDKLKDILKEHNIKMLKLSRSIRGKLVEINGEFKTRTEWAKEYGITENLVTTRLNRGLKGEELIQPPHRVRRISKNNKG